MSAARRPNFFIVGAPRCGTTALFRYLGAHPDVFEPAVKEPYYFGRDLLSPAALARENRLEEYLALYEGWTTEAAAGDGTPWALYSKTAAKEIAAFAPDARIIAMVRDPVQMLHSFYHILQVTRAPLPMGVVKQDGGVCLSFEEALETADQRRAEVEASLAEGTFTGGAVHVFHPDVARYTVQIQRYLNQFGPRRVHVVPYDQFRANTAAEYRRVLEFLNLDVTFAPPFIVHNRNRRVRSQGLHRRLRRGTALGPLGGIVKAVVPREVRKKVVSQLIHLNVVPEARPVIHPETVTHLQTSFFEEVGALGELLKVDLLTRWGYRGA